MDADTLRVRVERQHIGFLCGLLAGYEGLAIVRTLDPQRGLVELLVAPAFQQTVTELLRALSQEMSLGLSLIDD
jgi:hypothetical protein